MGPGTPPPGTAGLGLSWEGMCAGREVLYQRAAANPRRREKSQPAAFCGGQGQGSGWLSRPGSTALVRKDWGLETFSG